MTRIKLYKRTILICSQIHVTCSPETCGTRYKERKKKTKKYNTKLKRLWHEDKHTDEKTKNEIEKSDNRCEQQNRHKPYNSKKKPTEECPVV